MKIRKNSAIIWSIPMKPKRTGFQIRTLALQLCAHFRTHAYSLQKTEHSKTATKRGVFGL